MEILKTYHNLESKNKTVVLVWIKAHVGIPENEIVDKLAKDATKIQNINCNLKIPFSDFIRISKERLFNDWQMQYNECNKGSFYKKIFPLIPKISWFNSVSNRSFIRIISRIRTSHALYPKHKKRIGIGVSEYCDCGEIGDLEHSILECINLKEKLSLLFNSFKEIVHRPFNLSYLISLSDINTYRVLYRYIKASKIEL